MYENLGRLMGRTYEETVQILLKLLKNADVIFFNTVYYYLFTFCYSHKHGLKFIRP